MAQNSIILRRGTDAADELGRHVPERSLVDKIRAGDQQAFAEMYRQYAPMVHGVVLARVAYDHVQDIVQDVFVAAYKGIGTLRNDGALGAWLGTIARNHAAEHYRKARPTEELTGDVRSAPRPTAEAAEVLREIRHLPEAYRESLILRLVEGLTGQEIAEQTGLTPESVRVNLHRGMEMLRQRLGITKRK